MPQHSKFSLLRESGELHGAADLRTTKEAARLLRVHPHTLEVWRATGRYPELRFLRVGRRAVRYRLSDIEGFISAGTVQSKHVAARAASDGAPR